MECTFGSRIDGKAYRQRVGAYAVALDPAGRVALVEAPAARTEERWLFLPGGGIEPGESPEDCVRRECLEETGHTAWVEGHLCTGEEYVFSKKSGDYMHLIGHCYKAVLGEKVREPIEPDHVLIWVDASNCADRMFLSYQAWAVQTALEEVRHENQVTDRD